MRGRGGLPFPAGSRKTKRRRRITVQYQDQLFKPRKGMLEGFAAQIIRHGIDDRGGVLI
ncbi:MAG: peptide deformylase [Clostridia bacterium]|nr:peptide deformylase [Clostridia bacterium]